MPDRPQTYRPVGHRPGPARVAADRTRGSAHQRGYDSRWQRARLSFLADNPLCVECSKGGRIAEATVVDHVKPHRGDNALFWDRSNWQALCKPCHDRKTGKGA